jgi:hypothetical protein
METSSEAMARLITILFVWIGVNCAIIRATSENSGKLKFSLKTRIYMQLNALVVRWYISDITRFPFAFLVRNIVF